MISHTAYETAAWYKSIFLQVGRFFEADSRGDDGDEVYSLPYKKYNAMPYIVERHYLILSIAHFVDSLEELNVAMLEKNDDRVKKFYENIVSNDSLGERINQLRNENEHKNEYRLGLGHNEDKFKKVIDTELGKVVTNGHWSMHIKGDYFIGDINIVELIKHLLNFREEFVPLLEKIQWEYLGKKDEI